MSPHLGRRISALVDDQLPADERERALGHLVGCGDCRTVVESERRAKRTVQTLPAPELPAALLARLADIGAMPETMQEPAPRARAALAGPASRPASRAGSRGPRGGGPAGRPGARADRLSRAAGRPVRYTLAAVSVAGATLVLTFAAAGGGGSAPTQAPAVVPAVGKLTALSDLTPDPHPFPDPQAVTAQLGVAWTRSTTPPATLRH